MRVHKLQPERQLWRCQWPDEKLEQLRKNDGYLPPGNMDMEHGISEMTVL